MVLLRALILDHRAQRARLLLTRDGHAQQTSHPCVTLAPIATVNVPVALVLGKTVVVTPYLNAILRAAMEWAAFVLLLI